MEKLTKILSGITGEYSVAAELSKRGFLASLTLKNTVGVDILVANQYATKSVGIQVKTNNSSRKAWLLNKKAEKNYRDGLFYIFVNLKSLNERPDYYIVSSKIVADFIKKGHKVWLNTKGKKGQSRKDTSMRMFKDPEDQYLEKWDLLKL